MHTPIRSLDTTVILVGGHLRNERDLAFIDPIAWHRAVVDLLQDRA